MDEVPAKKKFSVPVLIAVVVVVLAVLGAVGWLAFRNSGKPSTVSHTSQKATPKTTVKPSGKVAPATASTAPNCLGVAKGNTLAILYRSSGPVPSCEQVKSTQSLVVINSTSQPVSVSFAGQNFTIAANKSYQLNKQFGTYLSTGVHDMNFSTGGTAKIWEK